MPSQAMRRASQSFSSLRHMPVIEEFDSDDDTGLPPLPEKSARRSQIRSVHFDGSYPVYPPPAYSTNTPSSDGSHFASSSLEPPLKSPKRPSWITRRGGWWRVGLVALCLLVLPLALTLSLFFGLKKGFNNSNSPEASTSNTNHSFPLAFPAGSYTFNTALANTSSACTSNAATFRCYPFTTYSSSHSNSAAAFHWTMKQVGSEPSYTISAAPNPFVPQFDAVPLRLLDAGQTTERLAFEFRMDFSVVPASALDVSNAAATCRFNGTRMGATIWTRKPAEFPANLRTDVGPANPSTSFGTWPFAVQVYQVASPGTGTPDCRDAKGNSLGNFAASGGDCSCAYSNVELGP